MTGTLALAYVTAVLKGLLVSGVARAGVSSYLHDAPLVTNLPPDRILVGESEPTQINLFLYKVTPGSGFVQGSAMLRSNSPQPTATPEGPLPEENTPLLLDLHYLLTTYGNRGFEIELLLGMAVRLLHERRELRSAALQEILGRFESHEDERLFAAMLRPDAPERVQQITIAPQFLDTEELSRLWSALQARYRPSVAYKVSMLLSTTIGARA